MKKILTILGTVAASIAYSQGTIIVNNYSKYDFHGALITSNSTTGCYPRAGNHEEIVIPADSHMGNGKELKYEAYRDQFTNSLYPTANWEVTTSPSAASIMPWNDANLSPGSTIATTTKWVATKFYTTLPGTNTITLEFRANLGLSSPCSPIPLDYFVTPSGDNSAEIFVINGITYLQLY